MHPATDAIMDPSASVLTFLTRGRERAARGTDRPTHPPRAAPPPGRPVLAGEDLLRPQEADPEQAEDPERAVVDVARAARRPIASLMAIRRGFTASGRTSGP